MVEESTAASHSLAQEANQLAHLISQFDIGAVAKSGVPRAGKPKAVATAKAPAARAHKVVAAKSAGSALPKADEATESDWKDF